MKMQYFCEGRNFESRHILSIDEPIRNADGYWFLADDPTRQRRVHSEQQKNLFKFDWKWPRSAQSN